MKIGIYNGLLDQEIGDRKFDVGGISTLIFENGKLIEYHLNNVDHMDRVTEGADGI